MTYMLLLNCALKLVEEIILYYGARSKKHQITDLNCFNGFSKNRQISNFMVTPQVEVFPRGLTDGQT